MTTKRLFQTIIVFLALLVIGLIILQVFVVKSEKATPEEVPGFIPPENLGTSSNAVPSTEESSFPSGSASGIRGPKVEQQEIADPVTLLDIPDSEFKKQLKNLPADIQKKVLGKIHKSPQLLNDIDSIRVDAKGMIYYVCKIEIKEHAELMGAEAAGTAGNGSFIEYPEFTGPVPNSSPPAFHSRPGCEKVLFLDFNGHDITGTAWNSSTNYAMPTTWNCKPYDKDGNEAQFSISEQETIYETWLRVSEDYAPFDVDVTTEQPAEWTSTTGHALITPTVDANGINCPHFGYGGVAYLDVFGDFWYSYNRSDCYSPAWVKDYSSAADIAEVVSHELGHNMGLHHDGATWDNDEYYDGHQNGSVSWAAIMGAAYGYDVTQWSKGDYYASTNPEDDLDIISGKLAYIPDDYGDSAASATYLALDGDGAAAEKGVIEQTDDQDVFLLSISSRSWLNAKVRVAQLASDTWGANLDVLLEVRDSSENLVASNNAEMALSAELNYTLESGTYFLHVIPTGVGDPLSNPPTGYTSYGSLGQYELLISVVDLEDSDHDGLPNDWEDFYFDGPTNANPTNIAANGVNTVMETYIADISPIDPNAFFNVSSTSGNGFIVSWTPVSGRVYSVHSATNLYDSFQPLETNILWPQSSWTDTVPRVEKFYQVDVQLQK